MASGELTQVGARDLAELPLGSAITASGRISAVTEPGALSVHYPFPTKDLVILDNALKYGSRAAKARFAVYIGDLGEDTAAAARDILARVPTPDNAVLLAVSPNQKVIEVVYGSKVKGRGIEESAPLGGFRSGRVLQGGQPHRRSDQRHPRALGGRLASLNSLITANVQSR